MPAKLKVYDVDIEEVTLHRVRVRAASKGEAEAQAEQVMEERSYGAEFVVNNGVPDGFSYKAAVSKDQNGDVDNVADDGSEE